MKCASLYVGLVLNILLGIAVGVTVYALMQIVSDSYIRLNYASDDRREEREIQQIGELQEYIITNELEVEDLIEVAEWSNERRYLYLMLYDGDRLVFTSDLGIIPPEGKIPESSDTVISSGFTVDHPTNATLRRYASDGAKIPIVFGENILFANVYDYSEYMQHDLMNILSMAFAFISLAFIIINYFRRIVKRIRRLEAEVTIVTHSDMEHKIARRGLDEIGRLSTNIDNMRMAILENLNREREARDANTELITAMSHDIRTPLTILLGYLEMMKSEVADQPQLMEYAETSERTALRLKQLSDDMFKYSLAYGNSLDGIALEPYDAEMLFEQMLSEHVLLLHENGYTVEVKDELLGLPEGAVVVTEPQNLMRIIDNVFSNVRKYADISKPVFITVKRRDDGRMMFECSNTVRSDTYKAESNKIGLKTCERLATKIADRFEYGLDGEIFTARLYMRVETASVGEEMHTDEKIKADETKKGGITGVLCSVKRAFRRAFDATLGALLHKSKARRLSSANGSNPVPSIKPIGYAPHGEDAGHKPEDGHAAEHKTVGAQAEHKTVGVHTADNKADGAIMADSDGAHNVSIKDSANAINSKDSLHSVSIKDSANGADPKGGAHLVDGEAEDSHRGAEAGGASGAQNSDSHLVSGARNTDSHLVSGAQETENGQNADECREVYTKTEILVHHPNSDQYTKTEVLVHHPNSDQYTKTEVLVHHVGEGYSAHRGADISREGIFSQNEGEAKSPKEDTGAEG